MARLDGEDREFVRRLMLDEEPGIGRRITAQSAWAKVNREERRRDRLRHAFRALRPS